MDIFNQAADYSGYNLLTTVVVILTIVDDLLTAVDDLLSIVVLKPCNYMIVKN